MSVSQISVFTQSKPGYLLNTLSILEDANVNLRGYSVSDTGDYGIARFIVDDPNAAKAAFDKACVPNVLTEVLCVKLKDSPGELARILQILSDDNVNVLYSYSMISTYIVIYAEGIQEFAADLIDAGFEVADQEDIANI